MATKAWHVDRAALFNWTLEELRKEAKRVFEAGNRRLRNIRLAQQYKGAISPAYNRVMETGGFFSKRDKNKRELIRELNRAYVFLNSQEGATVNSAIKYGKQVREYTPNLTDDESRIMWRSFDSIYSQYPAYITKKGDKRGISSDQLIERLTRVILDARQDFYGGLARDLVSPVYKEIEVDPEERLQAIKQGIKFATNKVAKEIESWANAQMNPDGTMNVASQTFKMKLSDVVPDMRGDKSINLSFTSGTKYTNNPKGDGVIKAPDFKRSN